MFTDGIHFLYNITFLTSTSWHGPSPIIKQDRYDGIALDENTTFTSPCYHKKNIFILKLYGTANDLQCFVVNKSLTSKSTACVTSFPVVFFFCIQP